MWLIIIGAWICWIISFKMYGFNLAEIMSFISTILFTGRIVMYHCKISQILMLESLGLLFTIPFQVILKRFSIIDTLIVIVVRAIFVLLVYYDSVVYVYYTEEVKREDQ